MGLLGSIIGGIGSIFSGLFGGSSEKTTHNYNYEPDKVRIAEIEQETKLKLAAKEAERIELMRDAQLELLKAQTMSQMAIEKARVEGMTQMANQLVILQEKMTEVAQKRIEIISACSLPIIKDLETFYSEVGEKIQAHNDEYNEKKLPKLLDILGKYEIGTAQHEIYSEHIRREAERQEKFIEEQMTRIHERQTLVLQSFVSSREKILEQTAQITKSLVDGYVEQQNLLTQAKELPSGKIKELPPAKAE